MRIAIIGYGNLGKGVEAAANKAPDMDITGIFTRRDSGTIKSEIGTPVYSYDALISMKDEIDVAILCGGSATDLPEMTPELAANFNVVDSYDNHHNIPKHYEKVDSAAKAAGNVAIISTGWDPGLFSLARIYANAALPKGSDYTFWGRGISQGHSDAIRRIDGVKDARQYTVPIQDALDRVRAGENPVLTTAEKHKRECYVVAEEPAQGDGSETGTIEAIKERITEEIVTMPDYFADYETTVTFISQAELNENHKGMPHGGTVIRTGQTGFDLEYNNRIEYSLELDSNPFFTGSILAAFGRAAYRLSMAGETGCKTVFDVPPILLLPEGREEVISHML